MRPSPFQAFVRIMMGCDKFCTYCIVPAVRGPEQSRPPDAIVDEARQLADQGVKEITLLGQTVNSYSFTTPDGRTTRLSDLLARLHEIAGIERIKFITNFPNDMTDDLLQAVRDLPRVSRYLHVPAQSGCDEVLKRMKRMYTVALYDEMMHRIRETIPGCAVSSDFIVGFCGETEASFEKSMATGRAVAVQEQLHLQVQPPRWDEGRPALRRRRARGRQAAPEQRTACLPDRDQPGGQPGVRRPDGRGPGRRAEQVRPRSRRMTDRWTQLTGRTACDRIVVFDGHERLIGQFVPVTVGDVSPVTLFGEVATTEHRGALA